MKTFVKNGKTYAKRADLTPWGDNPRDIKPAELHSLGGVALRGMEQ